MCCSLPVPKSFAETFTIPLASISKVTSICGMPLLAGGIPSRRNWLRSCCLLQTVFHPVPHGCQPLSGCLPLWRRSGSSLWGWLYFSQSVWWLRRPWSQWIRKEELHPEEGYPLRLRLLQAFRPGCWRRWQHIHQDLRTWKALCLSAVLLFPGRQHTGGTAYQQNLS